jgi:hypothetical protein
MKIWQLEDKSCRPDGDARSGALAFHTDLPLDPASNTAADPGRHGSHSGCHNLADGAD